ncbi:hypothetical protein GCM10010967_15440 [Dyadobacter beijingensis]|uniref:Glycine zipper n=1 Tax=Dyadobacter beijingensis TaxID=365489 RepID=A0ABQ2HKG3_9BACT|nr:hypothetical protein [Dyadobacter beijingensis]GGM84488.1 hypothetical protein GCM10010967_15440 [Dyadobacter beijingensis]
MQSSIVTSKKQCSGEQWSSLVPAVISTSFGGAVIGGSIAQLTGALVGGAFGIFIAFCSEYKHNKTATAKN